MTNVIIRGFNHLWQSLQQFSLDRAVIFVIQLILIIYLAFLTPLFIRYAFVVKFVDRNEPLEFTFQTCQSNLEGVCSFPEAVIAIDEVCYLVFVYLKICLEWFGTSVWLLAHFHFGLFHFRHSPKPSIGCLYCKFKIER